tara:strand:+ start:168 stop:434 length:267 start_codon:yes stop_codon:yes gene_type:complete
MEEFRGSQKTLAESKAMGNRSNSHRRIRRDRSGSAKRLIIDAAGAGTSSSKILATSGPMSSRPPMMKSSQAKEAADMSKEELITIIEN